LARYEAHHIAFLSTKRAANSDFMALLVH